MDTIIQIIQLHLMKNMYKAIVSLYYHIQLYQKMILKVGLLAMELRDGILMLKPRHLDIMAGALIYLVSTL